MAETIPRTGAVLLVTLFLSLHASAAHGASAEGKFAVKEAGTQTCQRFIDEREKRSNAYFAFLGWVAGYVSYYNKATPDTTDVLSWQTMDLVDPVLANYCGTNLEIQFVAAVENMLRALYPSRLREPSEMVDIKGAERPIKLYKSIIRRIQEKLAGRGYYTGVVDGDFGPATSAAIMAFQRELKLKETGYPDQLTLLRLFQ